MKKKKFKNPKKALRLVSYNDDTIVSEDEDMAEEEEEEEDADESDDDDDDDDKQPTGASHVETGEESVSRSVDADDNSTKTGDATTDLEKEDRWAKYGFSLPPEPKGKCPQELQEKINLLHEKMKLHNMDMNRVIQERKEFRNPSIYEKLISFCDINEFGTNYPPEIYDPLQWGPESFYEELAKAQKIEMDRREKDRKDNSKVELALAAAKKVEEEAKRRKSKWDQPGPSTNSSGSAGSGGQPVGVVSTSKPTGVALTTNITGTKGTVISAFGSLPKKPKV